MKLVTSDNMSEVSIGRKIVAFSRADEVFVLSQGKKNGYCFMPLVHDSPTSRYQAKSAKQSIQSAVQNQERVYVLETPKQLSQLG